MILPEARLEDFDYNLPKERIALYPEKERSKSRLIVGNVGDNSISHYYFKDIVDLFKSGTHIILNSTKVISARIMFKKPTGGHAEVLLVEPLSPSTDPQLVLAEKERCTWKCIIGGRRILDGMVMAPDTFENKYTVKCRVLQRTGNEGIVEFFWNGSGATFADVLDNFGKMPLPPYIKRDTEAGDKESYQTVYADTVGSVAAPTAGLHFTSELLNELKRKGINVSELVLHVGPGTFQPIESSVGTHIMHSEMFSAGRQFLSELLANSGRKLAATGTTALRTLESLYWIGVKVLRGDADHGNIYLTQYEPYIYMNSPAKLPGFYDSINELHKYMEKKNISRLDGRTQLFIVPGYKIMSADMLITNFHLPKSTLILLVAAFIGKDFWRKIYNEALAAGYRFLSYGDSSLLIR